MTTEVSRRAVPTNLPRRWERPDGCFKLNYKNEKPISVTEFTSLIGKFKNLSPVQLDSIQRAANERYATIKALAGM